VSPFGAFRLLDLEPDQCRFACDEIQGAAERHRFCGKPTAHLPSGKPSSWCAEHLKIVSGIGTLSERQAGLWDIIRRVA
jgi:hypothetical protein